MKRFAVVNALLVMVCLALVGAGQPSAPQPQGAAAFITATAKRYPIVELSRVEGTGNANELDLIAQLLADRNFSEHVDDIVIECANSRYQPMLDRYVAGGDVPEQQLAVVWRKTTQIFGCEADPTTEMLIDLVRRYNVKNALHPLRVLAADPPIDWNAIHTSGQFDTFLAERDTSAASVIEKQVIARHRRALVVIGGFHFTRWASPEQDATITMLLEKHHPGSMYVIFDVADVSRFGARTREMFASWPSPVVAPIAGTDLALQSGRTITSSDTMRRVGSRWVPVDDAFPGHTLGQLFDAVLYLGPAKKLRTIDLKEPTDQPYASELKRLRTIVMGTPQPL